MSARNEVARNLDAAAAELDRAAAHLRVAAVHFRSGRVPPGCAHAFAAEGHMARARGVVDGCAVTHAAHAGLPGEAPQVER